MHGIHSKSLCFGLILNKLVLVLCYQQWDCLACHYCCNEVVWQSKDSGDRSKAFWQKERLKGLLCMPFEWLELLPVRITFKAARLIGEGSLQLCVCGTFISYLEYLAVNRSIENFARYGAKRSWARFTNRTTLITQSLYQDFVLIFWCRKMWTARNVLSLFIVKALRWPTHAVLLGARFRHVKVRSGYSKKSHSVVCNSTLTAAINITRVACLCSTVPVIWLSRDMHHDKRGNRWILGWSARYPDACALSTILILNKHTSKIHVCRFHIVVVGAKIEKMKIAVLGTGNVGLAIGKNLTKDGHDVKYGTRDASSEKIVVCFLRF